MRYPAKKMTKIFMRSNTYLAAASVEEILDRVEDAKNDARREERIEAGKCKACFYIRRRMGGATITTQPCMCCGKDQRYGSTATDVLCLECAKEHSLCKQCGGDLEMRIKRRKWPKPVGENDEN